MARKKSTVSKKVSPTGKRRATPIARNPASREVQPRPIEATDALLAGLAILQCYLDATPDERAKDRYVLWAAQEKFEAAYDIVEMLPSAGVAA